jgi:DNA polymerase II large subunit
LSFSADQAWNRVRTLAPFPATLEPYYLDILSQFEASQRIALEAKAKGIDPSESIESKTVFDLADRVDRMLKLDQFGGLVDRLRELLRTTSKERAALAISQEMVLGKFGSLGREEGLDYGVRTALAIMTDGVTVAPLEGISSVRIKQNDDNSDYVSVSYAGPMRSAGGTEAGFSLVIADVTGKKLGLQNYRARAEEIDRFAEELRIYERDVGNFQYKVTDDDIRRTISNLPVEIDGLETDPIEVVVHRGLKRVSTDRLRGGALRVLNDGIIGRANKLSKKLASLNISGWEFLSEIKGATQQSANETEKASAHFEEVISGRAVLSMPKSKGGFRLRYGRSINTGLSTVGIHPAVATLLDFPVVVGTQVKVDMPGKAATIAFVDSIEGPTILTTDGSVVKVRSISQAEEFRDKLVKILDLGDVLISYGDFLENNKPLPLSPYVPEWWAQDLLRAFKASPESFTSLEKAGITVERAAKLGAAPQTQLSAQEALAISYATGIPLHPAHAPRFDSVTASDITELRRNCTLQGSDVVIDITSHHVASVLNSSLVEYRKEDASAVVSGDAAVILAAVLDLANPDSPLRYEELGHDIRLSGVWLGSQTTTTIGIRVGRPEKAMVRRLKPPVHTLFPVGYAGGPSRDAIAASKQGKVFIDVMNMVCPECSRRSLGAKCEACGAKTYPYKSCPRCETIAPDDVCPNCRAKMVQFSKLDLDLKGKLDEIAKAIPFDPSKPIKGVRGLTSASKTPEPLEKGVLRSRHNVYVYKDGTLRIDITNAPLTHFRPKDIKADLQDLIGLGYETDHRGEPLRQEDQLLELKPQDIIVPAEIARDLLSMSRFVDDELKEVYGLAPYYQAKEAGDLLGQIVIGLAPHTSVGVAGRIIGFSATQVCFANPYWHAAKRRDCDGDGDSLLLLMDVFVNFSLQYIPHQIGGMMDTPLLVQPIILPAEVDEQAHNFDITSSYPLDFYEKTEGTPPASSVHELIEDIGSRLGNERQFYGYGFTHDTNSLTIRRSRGAYSTMKTLSDKISKQIEVASKIEAVSTKEVVESIIKTHLIRDIMGNAKKYATQSFKCKKCGATIRRPPLTWTCPECGGEVRGTLTRASVEKYLTIAQRLGRQYDVDPYLRSRLEMLQRELDQLFQGHRKAQQLELFDFAMSS